MEIVTGESPEIAPDGPNLYGYVRSSPIMRFDPLGDQSIDSVSSNPGVAASALQSINQVAATEAAAAARAAMAKATSNALRQAAQHGRKSIEKSIKSFKKRIDEHLQKVNNDPCSICKQHWEAEIKARQTQMEAFQKVLNAMQ